ncbi:translocation/assembly module TamB domain-containing protein [Sphingomonas ginsenosidimutans]|uniref:translocation/assembly module TamB domain-containing protein n=2 Tax=Sphingomonas TaxID=13687 RepID=UPI001D84F989|nr:translocation/assembly module TamB domain-containing protein [Sphingomonas ginsenosidimutans]MBY0302302.1 translocation/assembly module TamB domain-containing protein [Sphingomonas ginsenosidimutans]
MRRALRHGGRIALAIVAALAALVVAIGIGIDTDVGHRLVADRINALAPANGLRFRVGRIDGSLYGRAQLVDVRMYDPQGLVLTIPRAALDWRPWAWWDDRLEIRSLDVPLAVLVRLPKTRDTGRSGPILPRFDIVIGRLAIDRLVLGRGVTGVARSGRVRGAADIRDGHAVVRLAGAIAGSDTLALRIDSRPDDGRFDIDAQARGIAGGLLSRITGAGEAVALDVGGDGGWRAWQGRAVAQVGTTRIADLALSNRSGDYTLVGTLEPQRIAKGKLKSLTAPRVTVNGGATFANRRLDGQLSLRSAALAVEARGVVDLAKSAFGNVKLEARLLRPEALFRNMRATDMRLRAILDGNFRAFRFDYRITAPRFAFDNTGFEQARAAGRGRWSNSPVAVPVRFTAARVTGVGDVAGGILRNLSLDGVLRVTSRMVTGDDLALRSDKLTGRVGLQVDLRTGEYDVGLTGALGRYLIPGLGVVDVQSRLRVVPGAGRKGTRVVGRGTAQMVRLDNAFFRSLAGGLPRIETGLERTPDGILHFTALTLTAPDIRLTGNGYRRRDGTFHFEGAGRQRSYGPVQLVLDGRIEKPTIDLIFQRPNDTLGLRDVRAHLDPNPAGFAVVAGGGSRLGPFTAAGQIVLPPGGGQARIDIARLDVSGTRATGALDIVPGGFRGRMAIAGGGLSGALDLAPVGDVQRIAGRIAARGARVGTGVTVRQATLDFATLLDPAGAKTEATVTGTGLRHGTLSLARFAGNVRLVGETGEVRASIAGSRGVGFQIQTVAQLAPDGWTVRAQGTLGQRPIRLETPAVLRRDGDAWVLSPTRLTFAGGEATLAGRFGEGDMAVTGKLGNLPLAVLDIGYAGLGLGGNASGTFDLAARGVSPPTGRVNLTVRGLTRSGLLTSSAPIDLAVAGVLTPAQAGVRLVMASGGRVVGRAQAMLKPLGGSDDAVARLTRAPLFAQLRYNGPAETLWPLTRVELFDLSGAVAIAADVSGTLASPQLRGVVRSSNARIQSSVTGTVLSNIRAEGRFAGSRLQVQSFAADAGARGGKVSGTGAFDFGAANGVALDLRMNADRAVMIDRDDIGATVTGPLAFTSDGDGGVISGNVRLDAARYRLGQATAVSALPRLNVREINVPDGAGAEDDDAAAPWRLAIHAKAPGGLMVSGLGLRSEWSTEVDIAGTPTNPAITGRADLVRGDYEFAGRQFALSRGVIRFAGEVPANPALDIEANANATGLNATIRVTGVAAKPEIAFASTPALPQDELLSRLLFGTSITKLSAPEALQLAAAVAALQNGGNGLNPINAVRRAAGLDRLRILPADPQTGQGTSIAAGKFVTRRLYAEIITDGQGYSATRVEFQVTRWLSLLSSISTLGRQSANVRVSRDY